MEALYTDHSSTTTPQEQRFPVAGNGVSSLFPCSAKLTRYGANIKKKKKKILSSKNKAPNWGELHLY